MQPMATQTSRQETAILAAGAVTYGHRHNGDGQSITAPMDEAGYRAHPVSAPLGAVTASDSKSMLFSGWIKQNGTRGDVTAPHPVSDPFGTLTSRDTTALVTVGWREFLADLNLYDCYFRMMRAHEIGRGCGFDVTFGDHKGSFRVWGKDRDQVDGFGNAVSPPIGEWIGGCCYKVLHDDRSAA